MAKRTTNVRRLNDPRRRTKHDEDPLLKVQEVAQRWSVTDRHVYNLIRSGRLPAVNLANGDQRARLRVHESQVIRYERHNETT